MPIKSSAKSAKTGKTGKVAAAPGIVKIAGIQMASGPQVSANLSEAERLIEIAAAQGARIIALPEYFAIMGLKDSDKVKVREQEGSGQIQRFLSKMAKKHQVWLIAGSIPLATETTDKKVRNSCLVFDATGQLVARYDKIHLFGLDLGNEHYHEKSTIEPGNQVVVVDNTPVGRIGLSICYDLRFPELYRAMGEVDLIVVPSAFTHTTGQAHWEVLLRARAIENLAYLMAPAQGGLHPSGRRTWGQTLAIDPWGQVLAQQAEGPGVVLAECDWARVQELREQLPALAHRVF